MAGNGGARPGAGRKRKDEKHETAINEAEKVVSDRLPELLDNLFYLANGNYKQVTKKYAPAGTIRTGKEQLLVFPDKPKEELVLIEIVETVAAPDYRSNVYLVDRVMGKPVQRVAETDTNGNDLDARPTRETVRSKLTSLRASTDTEPNTE